MGRETGLGELKGKTGKETWGEGREGEGTMKTRGRWKRSGTSSAADMTAAMVNEGRGWGAGGWGGEVDGYHEGPDGVGLDPDRLNEVPLHRAAAWKSHL